MANSTFEQIVSTVEAAREDAEKFFGEKANSLAGRRLRDAAKSIADLGKQLRKEVSALKAERSAAKKAAKA